MKQKTFICMHLYARINARNTQKYANKSSCLRRVVMSNYCIPLILNDE